MTRFCAVLLVSLGSLSFAASSPIQDEAKPSAARDLFRDLHSAREAYIEKLIAVANGAKDTLNRDAGVADGKGDKTSAVALRARAKIAETCIGRLKERTFGSVDEIAALLQALLFEEVPRALLRDGLRACFLFKEGRGVTTRDYATGNELRVAAPEWIVDGEVTALAFSQDASVLRVGVELEDSWTVMARIRFPIDLKGHAWGNLLWGDSPSGADHVCIDKSGEVGVWQRGFHGAGLNVKSLKGWHTLLARAKGPRTTFFVDGVRRGESDAAVCDPIRCIGNIGAQDRDPQNLFAPVAWLAVYARAFPDDEIAKLKDDASK